MVSPIEGFVPSRRVRQPIGGGSKNIQALFGGYEEDNSEAERASRPFQGTSTRRTVSNPNTTATATAASTLLLTQQVNPSTSASLPDFVPSRKVRQLPGGGSAQISAIFG